MRRDFQKSINSTLINTTVNKDRINEVSFSNCNHRYKLVYLCEGHTQKEIDITNKCYKMAKLKLTKRDLLAKSTRQHRARLLKYYPGLPCASSFVLQTHFFLFQQQIFFVLVCVHPGNARVPPLRGQKEKDDIWDFAMVLLLV